MIEQKVPLVCFKEGSDDIVGVNMVFVIKKDDDFIGKSYERVSCLTFSLRLKRFFLST